MIIECENIKLQLINEDDLEQMRIWRNAPHVNEYMEYRQGITGEAQKEWYNLLVKQSNLYFKILVSDVPIGIIHLKEIDWVKKTAEAGIFVGRKDFIGGITPIFSVLVLMKVAFSCLQLNELFAKISRQNTNALNFNKQLGYQFHSNVNEEFDKYSCTKNQFYSPQSSVSRLNQLFTQHIGINIYINQASEWILPHLHVDDRLFHLIRG